MKICFYCDSIFTFGGVQRVLAVIATAISREHEVTILTHDSPASEDTGMYDLDRSGIKFRYLAYSPLKRAEYLPCKAYSLCYKKLLPHTPFTSRGYAYSSFPGSQRHRLVEELNRENYDIVVGVHAFVSLKLASVRKQLNARKVIGWMHNSYQAFFEQRPAYLEGLKNHFACQMKRLDSVVVLTRADAALYSRHLGLYPVALYNPLTLIPQGMCRPEAKTFLAVGRFSPLHKGFDLLIEAFARFAVKNHDWTLHIVGEGPEERLLRERISKYRLEGRVVLHPFSKNVQQYYAAASVYVLSSRWEGFGLVMVEAMAHGLPVIASDLPVVHELFDGKENVWMFRNGDIDDLADKLLAASLHPHLADLQSVSTAVAAEYQTDAIARQWVQLFEN